MMLAGEFDAGMDTPPFTRRTRRDVAMALRPVNQKATPNFLLREKSNAPFLVKKGAFYADDEDTIGVRGVTFNSDGQQEQTINLRARMIGCSTAESV